MATSGVDTIFFWGGGVKYIFDTNYKLLVSHFYFVLTTILKILVFFFGGGKPHNTPPPTTGGYYSYLFEIVEKT